MSNMPTPALGFALVPRGALALLLAALTFGVAAGSQGPIAERRRLDKASLEALVEQVVPGQDELAWRAIPWRATLRAGLQDATVEHKPVLLWAMNGHPLGCT